MPSINFTYVILFGTFVMVTLSAAVVVFIIYVRRKEMKVNTLSTHVKVKMEMQEQIFNMISAELHDNVGQVLSLAKVQINIIDQNETIDRALIIEIKENISKALIDLRDIAKSLNTEHIKLCCINEMTKKELKRIDHLGIQTSLVVNGQEKDISESHKLVILRIVQEGLQNIIKHARTKKITIIFNYNLDNFEFQIVDFGVGFDQRRVNKKDGLGLQNIFRRAYSIGGTATIISDVNKGTAIKVILPYA